MVYNHVKISKLSSGIGKSKMASIYHRKCHGHRQPIPNKASISCTGMSNSKFLPLSIHGLSSGNCQTHRCIHRHTQKAIAIYPLLLKREP